MYNPLRFPDDATPWPIPVTPGGPIGPRDHVGHLAEYQRVLDGIAVGQVGVNLTGDRRQGKTSLLNLLEAVLTDMDDYRVLRISAETGSAETMTSRLRERVRAATWLGREAERWALDLDVSFKGIHLRRSGGPRPDHERPKITDDLLVLAAHKVAPRRLIVIIDEITVFLTEVGAEHEDGALEFLRSLRRARQEGADNLAIVLSGSMGLHHVVPTMQAVNDLLPVRVGRLAEDEATFLARCLLLGAGMESKHPDRLAAAMATAADHGAFYLHHLTEQLRRQDGPVSPGDAAIAIDALLSDPDDPLDFAHYRDRLPTYYGTDAALAGQALDAIATDTRAWLTTDDVVDAVTATTGDRPDRPAAASVLQRLEKDHYLEATRDGTRFASDLLRRAWIVVRRLDR